MHKNIWNLSSFSWHSLPINFTQYYDSTNCTILLRRLKQRLKAVELLAVRRQNIICKGLIAALKEAVGELKLTLNRTIRRSLRNSLRWASLAAPRSNISGFTSADDVTTSLCSLPNRELSTTEVPGNRTITAVHSAPLSVPCVPLHRFKRGCAQYRIIKVHHSCVFSKIWRQKPNSKTLIYSDAKLEGTSCLKGLHLHAQVSVVLTKRDIRVPDMQRKSILETRVHVGA